jgi:hypothetical protein
MKKHSDKLGARCNGLILFVVGRKPVEWPNLQLNQLVRSFFNFQKGFAQIQQSKDAFYKTFYLKSSSYFSNV